MQSGTRFCCIWLLTLLAVLMSVGGFDVAVDPYDIFAMPRIAGFNARKPDAAAHQMMTKTYAADRARPVTLLLGSSRVDVGIDPASDAFPPAMRPVFNFGVGGQVYAGDLYALREALAGGRLKYAVLVVDFELALKDEPSLLPEQTARAATTADLRPNPARLLQHVRDMFLASLTLGAFLDSVDTMLEQHDAGAPDMAEDGASSDAELRAHTLADGTVAMFDEKDRGDQARNAHGAVYLASHSGVVPSLDGVARIVAFCRAHGVALTIVIPPVHARALAQWRKAGLWSRFQDWKIQLADIAHGAATLWDFSAEGAWTTETPVSGQGLRWFWESLHFKKDLGDLMMRRIFDGDSPGFGVNRG
jgi:hypothetical protein